MGVYVREGERERKKVGGWKGARGEAKGRRKKRNGRGREVEDKRREAEGKGGERRKLGCFGELREMLSLVVVEVSLLLFWKVLSFSYHM